MSSSDSATRFIGERLRAWRGEQNWSGPEAAERVSGLVGHRVDWPELRSYETGELLPGIATARCLAELYGRTLGDLVLPADLQRRRPRDLPDLAREELPRIRTALSGRGLGVDAAERFFELGQSARAVQAWLKKFSVDDALLLAAAGMGPQEARNWTAGGRSPAEAVLLKTVGMTPATAASVSSDDLGSAPLEIVVLRRTLGIPGAELCNGDLALGWDLLSSIPRALARQNGAAVPSVSHPYAAPDAQRWRSTTIPSGEWEAWRAREFDADEASVYFRADVSVEDACEWRGAGFSPSEASTRIEANFDIAAAQLWRDAEVPFYVAKRWHAHDLTPDDRDRWVAVETNAARVAAWIRLDQSPEQARAWLSQGYGPQRAAEVLERGGSADATLLWSGSSPRQIEHFEAIGVTPELVRQRRIRAISRLDVARKGLRDPVSSSETRRVQRVPRARDAGNRLGARRADVAVAWGPLSPPHEIEVCPGCSRPIHPGGLCGCS